MQNFTTLYMTGTSHHTLLVLYTLNMASHQQMTAQHQAGTVKHQCWPYLYMWDPYNITHDWLHMWPLIMALHLHSIHITWIPYIVYMLPSLNYSYTLASIFTFVLNIALKAHISEYASPLCELLKCIWDSYENNMERMPKFMLMLCV